jgi:hypothetical protein
MIGGLTWMGRGNYAALLLSLRWIVCLGRLWMEVKSNAESYKDRALPDLQ